MFRDLTALIVGDMNLESDNPDAMLAHVPHILSGGDFTLGNLEGPLCDPGEPSAEKAEYLSQSYIRAPVKAVETLRKCGFHAVNMANNHIMDFGARGLLQTLEALDKAGIKHTGSGRNIEEARQPAFHRKGGVKLGFVGFTAIYTPMEFPAGPAKPGTVTIRVTTAYEVPRNLAYSPGTWPRSINTVDPSDRAMVLDSIRKVRAQSDVVVASVHWGVSSRQSAVSMGVADEFGPSWTVDYQKDLGRAMIDAGANIVMGHHPARLHGMERYKDGLILYSLGNFVFGHWSAAHGMATCIAKGYIDTGKKTFTRFSFIPCRMGDYPMEIPRPTGIEGGKDVIDEIKLHSKEYGTRFEVEGEEVFVYPPA